jgi:hypothetical protein
MSSIADTLQDDSEWITIDLNPELDLLQGLAARLSNHILCKKWFQQAKLNLSYLGLGLAIEGAEPITDLETAILRMLENIRRKKKRLLITIDEVTNTKQMRVFAAFFQIMLRQNLPVFLLMTGLYENIYELQSEKSLTFLYRAPKIQLQSLEMNAIKLRYQSVFQISEDQAREMTRLTGGYPFAFQLLGYLTWNHQGHYQEVLQDYFVCGITQGNAPEVVLVHELVEEISTEHNRLRYLHRSVFILIQLRMLFDNIVKECQATALTAQ